MRKLLLAGLSLLLASPAFAQVTYSTDPNTRNAGVFVPSSGYGTASPTTTKAQGVVLLDPTTGVAYVASGGTGGGGTSSAVAQGSTTSGQTGPLVQGAVVTGNQTYTAGTTQPLNLTPSGRLKVGLSSAGNITPAAQLTTTLEADLTACAYRASPPTWSDGWTGALACNNVGSLKTDGSGATQPIVNYGAANIATVQVSVTTTATQLVAARTTRQSVTCENEGTTAVRIGGSGVTTSNGFLLPGVAGASVTLSLTGAFYGVTASGTAALSCYELY